MPLTVVKDLNDLITFQKEVYDLWTKTHDELSKLSDVASYDYRMFLINECKMYLDLNKVIMDEALLLK